MTTTDSIANMISAINNGLKTKLSQVFVPLSKNKQALLKVLQDEGYIDSFSIQDVREGIKEIAINLKYTRRGDSVIQSLVKVSKPGRKIYCSIKNLKLYSSGMGINILSTSQGIISERMARNLNIGGEVICKVF